MDKVFQASIGKANPRKQIYDNQTSKKNLLLRLQKLFINIIKLLNMGKGDIKTKKGKRVRGSYGKSRLRRPAQSAGEQVAKTEVADKKAEVADKTVEKA